jgi:hypothetical protein
MMLSGKKQALIQQVQGVSIHGTIYYDVAYTHVGEERIRSVRLGPEAVYEGIQAGDQVAVSYMMGVATGIELAQS